MLFIRAVAALFVFSTAGVTANTAWAQSGAASELAELCHDRMGDGFCFGYLSGVATMLTENCIAVLNEDVSPFSLAAMVPLDGDPALRLFLELEASLAEPDFQRDWGGRAATLALAAAASTRWPCPPT